MPTLPTFDQVDQGLILFRNMQGKDKLTQSPLSVPKSGRLWDPLSRKSDPSIIYYYNKEGNIPNPENGTCDVCSLACLQAMQVQSQKSLSIRSASNMLLSFYHFTMIKNLLIGLSYAKCHPRSSYDPRKKKQKRDLSFR